jgi:hypothetical protein
MLAEIGSTPSNTSGWDLSKAVFDQRLGRRVTVAEMFKLLGAAGGEQWALRTPLRHVQQLSGTALILSVNLRLNLVASGNSLLLRSC